MYTTITEANISALQVQGLFQMEVLINVLISPEVHGVTSYFWTQYSGHSALTFERTLYAGPSLAADGYMYVDGSR